ncbi:hypothetical protein DL546_008978 [Coniochaeta pulveracea]|uniref:Uncharacterized protein n=1 Tax=Coniochaeta pulveracea TaxID=177199 RepID=A0A420YJ35_9PEZI|nr:hypothetical protein DL546_008978 [Coniochaeta pulveracea]
MWSFPKEPEAQSRKKQGASGCCPCRRAFFQEIGTRPTDSFPTYNVTYARALCDFLRLAGRLFVSNPPRPTSRILLARLASNRIEDGLGGQNKFVSCGVEKARELPALPVRVHRMIDDGGPGEAQLPPPFHNSRLSPHFMLRQAQAQVHATLPPPSFLSHLPPALSYPLFEA